MFGKLSLPVSLLSAEWNHECRRCAHDRHIPKLFSKGNNMDPGTVPTQLQGLSQAEELLISAVLPVMSIYKLPHGQYGYSGHVIDFPQDVQSFATSLPCLAAGIRRVVEEALTWLMANNIYYQRHFVCLNQETLTSLTEDGDLSDLRSIQPVKSEAEVTSDKATTEDHYSSSFVPNAAPPATERETIQQALGQSQSSTLMWPSVGGTPIDEFITEGYFSMAFPTLFPTDLLQDTLYIYIMCFY
uniref:DUF6570 domain-containing protein n=1 Tax=Amphimedon queenslandica TaxID=400682 RepID=A0A1X7VRX9_AMPQE